MDVTSSGAVNTSVHLMIWMPYVDVTRALTLIFFKAVKSRLILVDERGQFIPANVSAIGFRPSSWEYCRAASAKSSSPELNSIETSLRCCLVVGRKQNMA